MQMLYIDESGSMTNDVKNDREKFFVISVLHVKNQNALKNSFKRFIKKYRQELKAVDTNNKMFDANGNFLEFKGSALTPSLKFKFLNYICINNNFKVFYVKVDNSLLKDSIVRNKEVGFNYILDKLLYYKIKNSFLPKDKKYFIQLDQRSVATKLRYTLEDFLYKSLILDSDLITDLELHYRDSQNVHLIQVADFFANLLYSSYYSNRYDAIITKKRNQGYISHEYNFPYNNNR